MKRYAFSMLELVFVIVIMGILGKFGVEFLANAYNTFIFTQVNTTLQSNSTAAVEFIAKRLEHRIKDSIIARKSGGDFDALGSVDTANASSYTILEWVATDRDGFRGDSTPLWSGIADLNSTSDGTKITSPETNTTAINALIKILSNDNSDLNDAALYFIGSSSDISTNYGWDANTTTIDTQNGAMHPINYVTGNANEFFPDDTNFTDVSEYYKLAWTANAVVLADNNLTFYTDYQPWDGDSYTDASKQNLLMQNVDTFQFIAVGSIVKIQVCVKTDLVEDYSLCKEKTIY